MRRLCVMILLGFVLPQVIFAAGTKGNFTFIGTGNVHIIAFGSAGSDHTAFFSTPWAVAEARIVVEESPDPSVTEASVLDQYLASTSDFTYISGNLMFIGPGSIRALSQYLGSNTPTGEDSVIGVLIIGHNYGALLQGGSLYFDPSFGGIKGALAVAGGDYTIEQYGGTGTVNSSGTYTPGPDDTHVSLTLEGALTGSRAISVFGTKPQQGLDPVFVSTSAWAIGPGGYTFRTSSSGMDIEMEWGYSGMKGEIIIDSEALKLHDTFEASDLDF